MSDHRRATARALALDLALALAHDLALDNDHDSDLIRDRALALACVLDLALDRAHDRVLARDLIRDLTRDRALDLARDRALALTRALARARARDRVLACDLGLARDLDLAGDLVCNLDKVVLSLATTYPGRSAVESAAQNGESRVAARMVAGLVWLLPAENRPRYREEYTAELDELAEVGRSRWAQFGYAARLGTRVWSLRAALRGNAAGVRRA